MFSGSSHASQGFASFAPQAGGFASTTTLPRGSGFGFGFGSASADHSSSSALGGFRFPASGAQEVPLNRPLFGSSVVNAASTAETTTPSFGCGFVRPELSGDFATPPTGGMNFNRGSGNTSSLFGPSVQVEPPTEGFYFGPPGQVPPSKPSLFWRPPATCAIPPATASVASAGGLFGPTSDKTNPLGRGLTTRECFAANDDKRFTQPAFASSKRSVWASIVEMNKPSAKPNSGTSSTPTPLFGGSPPKPSFRFGSYASAAKTTESYAPTSVVEANSQTGRMMSISAMAGRGDQSVEELRLTSSGQRATAATETEPLGFSFGGTQPCLVGTSPIRTLATRAQTLAPAGSGFPQTPSICAFASGNQTTRNHPTPGFQSPANSRNPFASATGQATVFGPSTTTATSRPDRANPFSGIKSSVSKPTNPLLWGFVADKQSSGTTGASTELDKSAISSGGFHFLRNEMATVSESAAVSAGRSFGRKDASESQILFCSFPGPYAAMYCAESVDATGSAQQEAASSTEEAASVEKNDSPHEPALLALPPLTPSYSKISGSRAKAFVRRAGMSNAKAFVMQSSHQIVAATPTARKFSAEYSTSPTKKPIKRIVVGRRDAEVWKHGQFSLRSSLFAKSVKATAFAFETAVCDVEEQPSQHENEIEPDKQVLDPSAKDTEPVDLDNYDL